MIVATDELIESSIQQALSVIPRPVTIDAFLEWYPENSEFRYELRRGVIIQMPKPKGKHSEISGELAFNFGMMIRQENLPYFIPKECVVKTPEDTGYEPDIVVLNRDLMGQNLVGKRLLPLKIVSRSNLLLKWFRVIGVMVI